MLINDFWVPKHRNMLIKSKMQMDEWIIPPTSPKNISNGSKFKANSPFTSTSTCKASGFHNDAYVHYDRLDYDNALSSTLVTVVSGEHNCQLSARNKTVRTALQSTKCYKPHDHDTDVYFFGNGVLSVLSWMKLWKSVEKEILHIWPLILSSNRWISNLWDVHFSDATSVIWL